MTNGANNLDRASSQRSGGEAALDPHIPIIDAHHHLWRHPADCYLLPEYAADVAGFNVRATVFVECSSSYFEEAPDHLKPVGESEFAKAQSILAMRSGLRTRVAAGIVGFADLRLGPVVGETLAGHVAACDGRFRGIRFRTAPELRSKEDSAGAEIFRDSQFRAGFAQLEAFGLSFDAWLYFYQLHELTALARQFPATTIVLNHSGGLVGVGPWKNRRAEVFTEWRQALVELATCPNVVVKIGGLGMRRCGFGFEQSDTPPSSYQLSEVWKPYIEQCVHIFGPDRCMFESNFPVDKVSCTYRALWNAYIRVTSGWTANERSALFHDTARRVYRIEP